MTDNNLIDLISLILNRAEKCASKPQLIQQILVCIINSVNCELITMRLGKADDLERYQAALSRAGAYVFQNIGSDNEPPPQSAGSPKRRYVPRLLPDDFWPTEACIRTGGELQMEADDTGPDWSSWTPTGWNGPTIESTIAIPFTHNNKTAGLMALGFTAPDRASIEDMDWYGHMGTFVGLTLTNWQALAELRERVKELSCLHGLTQLLGPPDGTIEEVLHGVVGLLPQAWLYAREASARIKYEGQELVSQEYQNGRQRQSAALMVSGKAVGEVEVSYATEKPDLDEGPFLVEERKLLDNVARQVAQYIERRLYEAEKAEIMDKLRHADRLAMIGQVAASVAHEINEPLTSILGYAQLAANSPDLPQQISADIDKVVATSLQVREIIRKTLLYSRKIPPKASRVNLSDAVSETLGLFEWRCRKEGITPVFNPNEQPLDIVADPGQIRQVITNLVINAIQAMPDGGELSLKASMDRDWVCFSVTDTGLGMTAEVVDKMFIPFFSTKEAGRGTGLGLSVVHDIVSELGGKIDVRSRLGSGTEIVVRFPYPAGEATEATKVDDGE